MADTPVVSARCAVHPEVAAVISCTRCGAFACASCTWTLVTQHDRREQQVCAKCRGIVADSMRQFIERPSRRAWWLGVGAILSAVPFVSIVVIPFAIAELLAIHRRQASVAGRFWAVFALVLSAAMGFFWLAAFTMLRR